MENTEDFNGVVSQALAHCPEISANANYWFFRTEGGLLFEPFITSQSIAIGYPSIRLNTLENLSVDAESQESLGKQLHIDDPKDKRPGLSAKQLLTFVHLINGGDFIIIPSWGSRELAIGVVADDTVLEKPLVFHGQEISGFSKRRAVKWLKRIPRDSVNPHLYKIFFAHQTITNISAYSQWVDILLFDFFKKGSDYHFVLDVTQPNGINARDLFNACVDLFSLTDNFTDQIGINEDSGAMNTRINLNSPGEIELISSAAKYIFLIAATVVALNGGGLKFDVKRFGMNVNLSTDGLIKALNNFLNDRKNRQLSDSVREKLDALKIESSKDVVGILDHINKRKK